MADKIETQTKDHWVLSLMGNLHTMKQTKWISDIDHPFLAERLERRGFQILSVMQGRNEMRKERTRRWLTIDHLRAAEAVRKTMSLATVHQLEVEIVANGAVIWECKQ